MLFLLVVVSAIVLIKTQTSKTQQETASVVKGSFLADFPTFPLFSGANIVSSQHSNQTASYQAYLTSSSSVSEIINWYQSELQKDGWNLVSGPDSKQSDDQNIILSKGNMTATVNVEHENNVSNISIYIIIK